ncbi:MAG TPA: hypothetical protein PKD72_04950 [Gemmatales bacterium]|mgnify:CR=1 FL=1|nr:hypothetical protein [Gemmatales bacterium]
MPTGPQVILGLKVAVALVTALLVASAVALALKKPKLHGILNTVLTVLTLTAVVIFEVIIRLLGVDVKEHMNEDARFALNIHLCFVIPLTPILLWMLITGWKRRIKMHLAMALLFTILWGGMFVTGMFYLPHYDQRPVPQAALGVPSDPVAPVVPGE